MKYKKLKKLWIVSLVVYFGLAVFGACFGFNVLTARTFVLMFPIMMGLSFTMMYRS